MRHRIDEQVLSHISFAYAHGLRHVRELVPLQQVFAFEASRTDVTTDQRIASFFAIFLL